MSDAQKLIAVILMNVRIQKEFGLLDLVFLDQKGQIPSDLFGEEGVVHRLGESFKCGRFTEFLFQFSRVFVDHIL